MFDVNVIHTQKAKITVKNLENGTVLMYNSHACRRVYDVKTVFKLSLILTVAAGSFSSRKQQEFRFVWYSVCAFELLWACAFSVCLCEKMYRCVLSKKGTYVEHLPFLRGDPAQTPLMQMTFHSKGHIRRNFQHLKICFCFRPPLLSWSCPLCLSQSTWGRISLCAFENCETIVFYMSIYNCPTC